MGGRSPPPMRPRGRASAVAAVVKNENRSEEHTSELQSQSNLVCRLLLEKKTHYSDRTGQSRRRARQQSTGAPAADLDRPLPVLDMEGSDVSLLWRCSLRDGVGRPVRANA